MPYRNLLPTEERVLLLAPTRRDQEITSRLLTRAGLSCCVCRDPVDLSEKLEEGAGLVLVTEEILSDPRTSRLVEVLAAQPSWSDLPIVLLARGTPLSQAAAQMLDALVNVTVLERPASTRTVVSAVRAALRTRLRQYQIRWHVAEVLEAEQQRRISQERFISLANTIPQLAWMARPDGAIFWYNERWHEYCGTSPESMHNCEWEAAQDPEHLPRVLTGWQEAVRREEPWEDTYPIRRHDGEYRWHLSRAQPFRDASGKVTLWFGTNTDVTEERQRVDERQRLLESERAARREAERASRMKDEFLATLSHELRTPLSAIFGWTQLLKLDLNNPRMLAEGIDVIDRNVRLQTQLIDDLLDMSRIVAGKVRLDVKQLELADVIGAAIEVVRPALDAKDIRLEQTLMFSGCSLPGDPGRLQQVFWNLLSNAVKFTPSGGTVSIAMRRLATQVEVRISDTGEGIDVKFVPHLFERFSQADGSMKRKHGGLGLGLSIVKSLTEMHGGTVRAESAGPGRGATFIVTLPLRASRELQAAVAESGYSTPRTDVARPRPLHGLKVLVVDDEPDARDLMKRFLGEWQAVPALAASAGEARQLCETFVPDVIVSDIGMPQEDGYAFMRDLRRSGCQTPAVALTAFARDEDRRRCLEAGYQKYLPKPVEPRELLTVIFELASNNAPNWMHLGL